MTLRTNSAWWADSEDRLYLGLHSTIGGREFRLNNGISLGADGTEFEFGLGEPCCSPDIPLVTGSVNGQHNSPTFNTLDLTDIDHVYLRKEQSFVDPGAGSDDDALFLDFVKVILCDVDGNLKRFDIGEPIVFADEAGLQHWLTPGPTPGCRISVHWDRIIHDRLDQSQPSAGWKWRFKFDAAANGQVIQNWDLDGLPSLPPGDSELPERYSEIFIPGCCGGTYKIDLKAEGIEKDLGRWPDHNDVGSSSKSHTITCTDEGEIIEGKISYDVIETRNSKKGSRITYKYRIMARCE